MKGQKTRGFKVRNFRAATGSFRLKSLHTITIFKTSHTALSTIFIYVRSDLRLHSGKSLFVFVETF